MSTPSRRWVKVWHEILSDHTFQDLTLEQQARFYSLMVYISAHGDKGFIEIAPPARSLVNLLQCSNFEHLMECIVTLPSVTIEQKCDNAKFGVSFNNWSKYQKDSTGYERLKRFRNNQMITVKEKEKEEDKDKEKNKSKPAVKDTADDFIFSIKKNPAYKDIDVDRELHKMDAWLMTPKGKGRKKTKRFILNWLNNIDTEVRTKQTGRTVLPL